MMLLGAVLIYMFVEGFRLTPVAANCLSIAGTTVVSYFAHRIFSFSVSD
jgi:putative flippase GtrA